ncbi:MAG: Trk system potassium transporter TrkA [Spirochaetes bacterium]|nr:Trk system potassium transporter TrkA [Spirochaetota bacterium]
MNVIIVGGGNVGVTIARKLISENHDVTVIDNNHKVLKSLRMELDALILEGDGNTVDILKKAGIKKASLYLAVTNNDNINIISCIMAKKLNPDVITVSKIQNAYSYFNNDSLKHEDFSIDMMIDPKNLSIEKIMTLIEYSEAIEIVNYENGVVQLVGVKIDEDFKYLNQPLKLIGETDEIFKTVRIVALYRNEILTIPKGDDLLLKNDKIYIIGKIGNIQKIMKTHFDQKSGYKNVVILGGSQIGKELAEKLAEKGKIVTIIEEDVKRCEELSKELNKISIINGYGTDESVLNEVRVDKSCFVCLTPDDEYNMISAVSAKSYLASKTICMIHNIALFKFINKMTAIDAVFSPNILTVGEILAYCRKGNITSVSTFSEINAETIDLTISEKLNILNTPLKNIKFPDGMIIGVIIRNDDIFIPTGDDEIIINDKLILFLLPAAVPEVEKFFSRKIYRRSR